MPRARSSFWRSLQYLWLRYVLRRRRLLARAPSADLELEVYAADVAGRHLFKRGVHEPDLTGFVLRQLEVDAGAVALDIGANLGWYSLLLARRFPDARVLAYEPEPRNYRLLVGNLERNGCARVEAFELAVADRQGEQAMYPYPEKNLGRHSLLPIHDAEPITIRSVRLDDHLAERGVDPARVQFVKIDVEGYELHALRGAPKVLAACPLVLSEYSPKYLRRGGVEPAAYLDLLEGAGFTPHEWDGERLCRWERGDLERLERRVDLVWRKGS